MADISTHCGDCDEKVHINPAESGLNYYEGGRPSELRFKCPVCEVVQLAILPDEAVILLSQLVEDKHHIAPASSRYLGPTPAIDDADAYDFAYSFSYSNDPLRELSKDERARHRERHPSTTHRVASFIGKMVADSPLGWYTRH